MSLMVDVRVHQLERGQGPAQPSHQQSAHGEVLHGPPCPSGPRLRDEWGHFFCLFPFSPGGWALALGRAQAKRRQVSAPADMVELMWLGRCLLSPPRGGSAEDSRDAI